MLPVTVLLDVSALSNDRRQEWHGNQLRDQNSRYSMCSMKTVLSDPARVAIEEQDRLIAERSGKPTSAVKSIRRSSGK
jgi:hypothetical protein